MNNRAYKLLVCATIALAGAGVGFAADASAPVPNPSPAAANSPSRAKAVAAIQRGAQFLLKQQDGAGLLAPERAPVGMHALAARALAQAPGYGYENPAVKKAFDKLVGYQMDSGGIYKDSLANYNTAIAISALAAADSPELKPAIDKAVTYLKSLQWTDTIAGPKGEKADDKNAWVGGWGYGGFSRGPGRPDLSNTQMALEALHAAGLKPEDPAYQSAMKFVSRLQNSSETNDRAWAGDDGGFVYGPSADGQGESFAGEYQGADGRRMLRSYGSMTYGGLKSMIYAGLSKQDPRVKAAWDWIGKNWTLEENPGMKAGDPNNSQYGLYYYYLTLARALRAYGEDTIIDPKGAAHDWRVELIDKLASLQREDGSWVGEKKWMEDHPALVTSYVLLALEDAVASLDGRK